MQLYLALSGLAALSAGVNALSITSPSGSSYWVQFTTNTIAWALESGDPTSVTLQVINPNNKQFSGGFAIAEYVPAAKKSFDVTNVTLSVADGYQIRMVNPMNNTQIFATSAPFSVRPSDTTPAPVTFAPGIQNPASPSTSSSSHSTSPGQISANSTGTNFKNSGSASTNAQSPATHGFEVSVFNTFVIALSSLSALAL